MSSSQIQSRVGDNYIPPRDADISVDHLDLISLNINRMGLIPLFGLVHIWEHEEKSASCFSIDRGSSWPRTRPHSRAQDGSTTNERTLSNLVKVTTIVYNSLWGQFYCMFICYFCASLQGNVTRDCGSVHPLGGGSGSSTKGRSRLPGLILGM